MPQVNKIAPSDVLSFAFNYTRNAMRKGGISSRQDAAQLRSQELKLTPENVGDFAKRIDIRSQFAKTQQQRFIDTFA
jgi:hypothetical protein